MSKDIRKPAELRYAGKEMKYIFSPDKKFTTWRKLWVALAESEKQLGLDITDKQIEQMKAHIDDVNYEVAEKRERKFATTLCRTFMPTGFNAPTQSPLSTSARHPAMSETIPML